ncbi:MAG TPA: GspH/FimT family pseudopilin [Dokdonella sp.]
MKEREPGTRQRTSLGASARAGSCCCVRGFPVPGAARRAHAARGFTLIELMAVIVLLAIALTTVTFSFSKSLQSARIRGASRDLVAALRYTRGQAIVKGQQEVLTLDLNNNSYQAPGKGAVSLPKGMRLGLTTAETEVTGNNVGGIRFFADGSSTGGHISVFQGQREWRINVAWLTGDIALDEAPEP